MDPSIQYVTTRDGVNIAYYAIGDGPTATLLLSQPWSHLEAEWRNPVMRAALTARAQDGVLVRLDPRGFGLSDRDIDDYSLDAMMLDIEAVTERIGLRQFGIYGLGFASVPAIAYAGRHPETTHLILQGVAASSKDFQVARLVVLKDLAAVDWPFASETVMRAFNPNWPDNMIKGFAEIMRASIEPDQFLKFWEAIQAWDADADAANVQARTLIIHNRQDPNADMRTTRRIAALIPNARIAFVDDVFEGGRVIREFIGVSNEAGVEAAPAVLPSGTAIILFVDIAGSTELTERLGDDVFRTASRALDGRLRAAIEEAGGTPIAGKLLGDGVLATFTSARQAVQAARRCLELSADVELPLHIGIHAGDVIREDGDVFGGAVNIASRICGMCEPGEILVSQTVRDLARTSAGVAFDDRGEHALKGIADPVRVFAVRPG